MPVDITEIMHLAKKIIQITQAKHNGLEKFLHYSNLNVNLAPEVNIF